MKGMYYEFEKKAGINHCNNNLGNKKKIIHLSA